MIDDFYTSFGGIIWSKNIAKTIHTNTCLYFSKGSADYIGTWDFIEFFIPRGKNKNLLDVWERLDFETPQCHSKTDANLNLDPPDFGTPDVHGDGNEREMKSSRGMADSASHPFCSLLLHSETTLDTFDPSFDRPVSTARAC